MRDLGNVHKGKPIPNCVECEAAGQKPDRIYDEGGFCNLMGWMPYYDSEGRRHEHDPNIRTTSYQCSNGHRWAVQWRPKCWCEADPPTEAP